LTPQLSIIIPTYNRKEVLLKALEGYRHQTALSEILEILVVDDGSTDGTEAAVAGYSRTWQIPIRYLAKQNAGQAAARNTGIRAASGSILLFTDDDIIPRPTLVAEHLVWHQKYPADNFSILGKVIWSPELHPTPFMEWLAFGGALFGYGLLAPGQDAGFSYLYTCNLSVKRDFLMKYGLFDETFRGYGYEDLELGSRLARKDFRIIYNDAAIGEHYKRMTYADARRREESICVAALRLENTEGGRYLKEQASPAKPSTLKIRLRKSFAAVAAPCLLPLIPLLDTQVRLPWIIYRILYYHHAVPKAQANFARRRAREGAKGI
jgi:glycosyltransferase involved in cell wall biosynthesis